VFEGDVSKAQYEIIKKGIKDIINKEKDSVIYYKFDSMNYSERGVIGVERNEIDSFI
jgi:CRISPR-associated protein Cas2